MTTAPALERPATAPATRRWRPQSEPGLIAAIAIGALLFAATVIPIAFLIYRTFVPLGGADGMESLKHVFVDSTYRAATRTSLLIGVLVGTTCTVIGAALAWLTQRIRIPMRGAWEALLVSGFAIPPVLAATAWTALLAPRAGFLNHFWGLIFGGDLATIRSWPGMIFVLTVVFVPLAYLMLVGPFAALGADEEEAALVHGCRVPHVLWHITLPAVRGALATTFVLVFVFAIQTFSVPLLLGEPAGIHTIPAAMYLGTVTGQLPPEDANALGVLLLVISLVAFVLLWLFHRRWGSRTGTAYRSSGASRTLSLGRWMWPATALLALYFVIAFVLPLASLVAASFMKYITPHLGSDVFTLRNYSGLFSQDTTRTAVRNTIVISGLVATVGTVLSLPIAYVIVRTKGFASRAFDVLASAPLAVPRLVLAFGFLAAVSSVHVLTTLPNLMLLTIVVLLTFFGIGVRNLVGTFERIGPEVDEAAWVGGAGLGERLLLILAPMSLPALVAIWRTLFVLSLLEVDVVIFLYQSDGVTLAVETFVLLNQAFSTAVFPLAVAQVVLCAVVVGLSGLVQHYVTRRMGGPSARRAR